jgi:type II secretory pathway pseudopilin PulG
MTAIARSRTGVRTRSAAGFSLVEVTVSVGIMLVIMGSTMTALSQAMKANQTAVLVTSMNSNLRTAMDLMTRDLLQVGSGLPVGHAILTPSGAGATQIKLPGPPGTLFKNVVGDVDLNAVNPGPGLGPVINGVATDMITTLAADSSFNSVGLKARASDGTSIDVDPAVNIATGPDRVMAGQLIMIKRGAYAVLLQVTSVDTASHRIFFAAGDSLNLNQHTAAAGSITALNALGPGLDIALPSPQTVPPTKFLTTTATRIRMVSYYLDATDAAHPRLVRRVNNGDPITFDNKSGTTVAFDIENLQISYDMADGGDNPANVRFNTADFGGTGACDPIACSVNQIRKVNVVLTARSKSVFSANNLFFHNALSTQVSLRGMAFVNSYTGT